MKFKGFWYDGLLISLSAGIAAFFIVLIAFVNPKLAISAGIAFLIICVFAVYRALSAKGRYKRFLIKTTKERQPNFRVAFFILINHDFLNANHHNHLQNHKRKNLRLAFDATCYKIRPQQDGRHQHDVQTARIFSHRENRTDRY